VARTNGGEVTSRYPMSRTLGRKKQNSHFPSKNASCAKRASFSEMWVELTSKDDLKKKKKKKKILSSLR
jgi:hypothetical protein